MPGFRAQIENENQTISLVLDLLDNGSGADRIANDGLYSRYFARYEGGDGRYIIKCQVKSTDSSEVNGGFINSKRFINDFGRAYPADPTQATPPCCGSDTITQDIIREPTGDFKRIAAGGSFTLSDVPETISDVFAPGGILDLSVGLTVC